MCVFFDIQLDFKKTLNVVHAKYVCVILKVKIAHPSFFPFYYNLLSYLLIHYIFS